LVGGLLIEGRDAIIKLREAGGYSLERELGSLERTRLPRNLAKRPELSLTPCSKGLKSLVRLGPGHYHRSWAYSLERVA